MKNFIEQVKHVGLVKNMQQVLEDITKLVETRFNISSAPIGQFVMDSFWTLVILSISAWDEIARLLAVMYVMAYEFIPYFVIYAVLYVLSYYLIKSNKPDSDATNVNLLDRAYAFMGFIVPLAEYTNYFPAEMNDYPFIRDFQAHYLTGITLLLNSNQFIPLIMQILCFREIIRRRGPDTEWSGPRTNRLWIKYYIRYYWCYGFLIVSLLEPYCFMQRKVIELFDFPYWLDAAISQTCFYFFSALLIHGLFFMLIGQPNYMPVFHDACEFHVGKPKK